MKPTATRDQQPIDVALFSPSMTWGGAEKMFKRLAIGFGQAGLEVDLVVASAEGPNLDGLPDTVRVIDLGSRRLLGSVLPLARYLRREKPRALMSTLDHANLVAIWAKAVSRSRTRLILREANTLSVASSGSKDLRDRAVPRLARVFYPHADAVVAVSRGVAHDLIDKVGVPEEMVRVIYNPTYDVEILTLMTEPVDHAWFCDNGPPIVIAVGRLSPQKRIDDLLHALVLARRERPMRLMVVGDGEERTELEILAKKLDIGEDVSLIGFSSNPYAYMAHADVYVLSSGWEGFPNTLVEAMACGLPVVSTDCPSGPREILGTEQLGFGSFGSLVPVGDPGRLSNALLNELARMGDPEIQRQRAERFSVARAMESYLELVTCGSGPRGG